MKNLEPGEYRVSGEWRGTFIVEEGDEYTEMDVVDDIARTGELVNWDVEKVK